MIALATLMAAVILVLVANGIYSMYEGYKYTKPGEIVDTANGMMHVYADMKEDSEVTYVFLSAAGGNSAYYDFKALWAPLSADNSVVTIDYLGYGMSENTKAERSVTNIVDEINTALSEMDIPAPYSFVMHSLGGYYGTGFAQAYPEKVADLIFIDTTTPDVLLDSDEVLLAMLDQKRMTDFKRFTGFNRLDHPVPIPGLTKQEQKAATFYNRKMALSSTVINELNHTIKNAEYLKGVAIPDSIPTLRLVSKPFDDAILSMGYPKTWREYHEMYMNNHPQSQMIMLDAGHYMHWELPEDVVETIQAFHVNQ